MKAIKVSNNSMNSILVSIDNRLLNNIITAMHILKNSPLTVESAITFYGQIMDEWLKIVVTKDNAWFSNGYHAITQNGEVFIKEFPETIYTKKELDEQNIMIDSKEIAIINGLKYIHHANDYLAGAGNHDNYKLFRLSLN